MEDEDAPAGIEGAQFFGGNKQKQEFFDPVAEAEAAVEVATVVEFNRFDDRTAFADPVAADVARSVQTQLLLGGTHVVGEQQQQQQQYKYADTNFQWDTPLQVSSSNNNKADASTSPLQALHQAKEFYRQVHVAITAGKSLSSKNQVELRWELSLAWPTFWEPRVLLTGTSRLTIDSSIGKNTITQQVDRLDAPDDVGLLPTIQRQLVPRFWDFYHIGMTPSAELAPRLPSNSSKQSLFSSYSIAELPPRWVLQPTLVDAGTRDDCNALILPNHAFGCVIKTMGPTKQRYTPTVGVQVQLLQQQQPSSSSSQNNNSNNNNKKALKLQWSIPLAVEFAAQPVWRLPPEEDGDSDSGGSNSDSDKDCRFVYEPRRRVATVPYGGLGPQDENVATARRQLYEQVVTRDGHAPKLDGNGRPIFFFVQNAVKACYTNEGLGMAVYEWRPQFTRPNEVGIELELEEKALE